MVGYIVALSNTMMSSSVTSILLAVFSLAAILLPKADAVLNNLDVLGKQNIGNTYGDGLGRHGPLNDGSGGYGPMNGGYGPLKGGDGPSKGGYPAKGKKPQPYRGGGLGPVISGNPFGGPLSRGGGHGPMKGGNPMGDMTGPLNGGNSMGDMTGPLSGGLGSNKGKNGNGMSDGNGMNNGNGMSNDDEMDDGDGMSNDNGMSNDDGMSNGNGMSKGGLLDPLLGGNTGSPLLNNTDKTLDCVVDFVSKLLKMVGGGLKDTLEILKNEKLPGSLSHVLKNLLQNLNSHELKPVFKTLGNILGALFGKN